MERQEHPIRHGIISRIHDIDIIGIRWLSNVLPKLMFPAPKDEIVMRTIHGFDLRIDPLHDTGVERSIYYFGTYERGTLAMLSGLLREGEVFVDVGANIGLMTIHAAHIVGGTGKVFSFEADPETCKILSLNIELNGVRNVEVFSKAVGSAIGHALIYPHFSGNRGRSSLIHPGADARGIDVDVVRLDHALAGRGPLSVVKMDIEGYELEALKGMTGIFAASPLPVLIVECSEGRTNSHGQGTKAIHDFLESLGTYRYFRPSSGKERSSKLKEVRRHEQFPKHDNIYCLTNDHLSQDRYRRLIAD